VLVENACGDGQLFKGVFLRHLRYYLDIAGTNVDPTVVESLRGMLRTNAAAVWANQNECGLYSDNWVSTNGGVDGSIAQQIGALDALNGDSDYAPPPVPCDGSCKGRCVGGRCVCACSQRGPVCAETVDFWTRFTDPSGVSIMQSPADATGPLVWLSYAGGRVNASVNLTGTEVFAVVQDKSSQNEVRVITTEKRARYLEPASCDDDVGRGSKSASLAASHGEVAGSLVCGVQLASLPTDAGLWTLVEVDQPNALYALRASSPAERGGGGGGGYLRVDESGASVVQGAVVGLQFQRVQKCIT
jgi:hypothetical protein